MKKIVLSMATVTAIVVTGATAEAGGWGQSGKTNASQGLLNVSPSVGLGEIKVLNGISILNGSPVASGNSTDVGSGLLGRGILNKNSKSIRGGNRYKMRKMRKMRKGRRH